MAYSRRRFNSHIKSLIHFDYPYYLEANDGCRDEINGNIFSRHGNVKFTGTEIPCDEIISGTPKFGYRCLSSSSNSDYIFADNSTGAFSVNTANNYEIECFVRITASSSGRIVSFCNADTDIITLGFNSERKIIFTSPALNLNLESSLALSLNTWYHLRAKLLNGHSFIFINGSSDSEGTYLTGSAVSINEIRIGGFTGQIDEFVFRDTAESSNPVPDSPYQGTLNISEINGFGNGTSNAVLTSNQNVNSYAMISSCSGKKLTLSGWINGKLSVPAVGAEIMIHVTAKKSSNEELLGSYAFRTIQAISGNTITINKTVTDEFNLAQAMKNYYVQVITIPVLNTLTINENVIVSPHPYSNTSGGGITAMRIKSNATIKGRIISSGFGPERTDRIQMTHSDLIDRFIINKGGGIFIACGGTFTASANSRIGASWSGSSKGGTYTAKSKGKDGGAGYGGAGGSDTDNGGRGGSGGVGGGGGGGDGSYGGNAGSYGSKIQSGFKTGNPGTGGAAGQWSNRPAGDGGIAGIMLNSENISTGSSGGAGAGGNAGNGQDCTGGISGACVIIIAKNLNADSASISTGGQGGSSKCYGAGGGGTGFCYMACEGVK